MGVDGNPTRRGRGKATRTRAGKAPPRLVVARGRLVGVGVLGLSSPSAAASAPAARICRRASRATLAATSRTDSKPPARRRVSRAAS